MSTAGGSHQPPPPDGAVAGRPTLRELTPDERAGWHRIQEVLRKLNRSKADMARAQRRGQRVKRIAQVRHNALREDLATARTEYHQARARAEESE